MKEWMWSLGKSDKREIQQVALFTKIDSRAHKNCLKAHCDDYLLLVFEQDDEICQLVRSGRAFVVVIDVKYEGAWNLLTTLVDELSYGWIIGIGVASNDNISWGPLYKRMPYAIALPTEFEPRALCKMLDAFKSYRDDNQAEE